MIAPDDVAHECLQGRDAVPLWFTFLLILQRLNLSSRVKKFGNYTWRHLYLMACWKLTSCKQRTNISF